MPRAAIGELRRRLVLEAPVEVPDGLGGMVASWQSVVALWARIEWRGGEERWLQGRPEQRAGLRITLRWRPGVDAGRRLRDGNRIYDIRAVADPDGDRRRLVCLCEEIGP